MSAQHTTEEGAQQAAHSRTAGRLGRVGIAARGLVHVVAGVLSVLVARSQRAQGATAAGMQLAVGRLLVGAAGLVVVGIGIGIAVGVYGLSRTYVENWHRENAPQRVKQAVQVLGVAGYVSRGVGYAAAGVFLTAAAVTFDPNKARGSAAACRRWPTRPTGPPCSVGSRSVWSASRPTPGSRRRTPT